MNLDSFLNEEGDKGGNRRRVLLLVVVWLPGLVCFHIACFNLDLWWLSLVSFAWFFIASVLISRLQKRKQDKV